jgi:SMP-30/gluconolaconase/LRE-like protein
MRSLVLKKSSFVFTAALAASACVVACGGSTEPAEAPQAEVAAPPPAPEPPKEPEAPKGPPPPVVVKDVGFETPESVLYDSANDIYLVSNISGDPLGKDDNGFISKLSPDGKVEELKWIDGSKPDVVLNAPKGLGIADGKLYVADIDVVRVFDLTSGKSVANIKVTGASFLNDISVAPDGTVYVSDTGLKAGKSGLEPSKKDAIYKLTKKNTAKALIKSEELKNPNGILADDTGVWVVSWSGSVYRVTAEGKKEESTQAPGQMLDGLVRTPDGQLLVSSWETSTVYLGKADGTLSPLFADLKSPADIGFDSKRSAVLVPQFLENTVQIYALPATPAEAATAPSTQTAASEKAAEEKPAK